MNSIAKKIISVVMSVAVSGCCAIGASAADFRYGDVDSNGSIDSADALAVLQHSVSLKTLAGDSFKAADVNGDGSVNSADALDILCHVVGSIDKFKVEYSVPELTKAQMLAVYEKAVAKARSERPSYKLKDETGTSVSDVQLGGLASVLLSAEEKEKMINQIIEEGTKKPVPFTRTIAHGSAQSLNYFVPASVIKDTTKYKSLDCKITKDGKYSITIAFKDESNPSSNSPVCTMLGGIGYDELRKSIEEGSQVEGASVTVSKLELAYKNCSIVCVIDPDTGEFVDLKTCLDSDIVTGISAMGVTVKSTTKSATKMEYFDFYY